MALSHHFNTSYRLSTPRTAESKQYRTLPLIGESVEDYQTITPMGKALIRPTMVKSKKKNSKTSAGHRTSKGAPQQRVGKTSKRRSPLKDVSASSISLQDAADFAGVIWKYGKYALAYLNVEEKESYQALYNGIITNVGVFSPIAIAQGLDYNNRTGDSIKVENLRIEYVLSANVTAAQNYTRVVVLRDFMNQGALPAAADIFQDVSNNSAIIVSPYKHSLGDRFEVLSDQVHCQVATDTSALIHKRLAYGISDHVLFQGTSSSVSDTWQGVIYVITVTDQSTNGPKLVLSSLVTYIDN